MSFESSERFLSLAAVQMRRVLIDLTRHYRRVHASHQTPGPDPEGPGPGVETQPAPEGEPGDLLAWEEFHRLVDQLDEAERQVVDLLWYHGLSKEEAAAELGCSARTVRRHWQNARLRLYEAFGGEFPL
jgi:RNA polymerase sigma-70 factor (ECF subfamily)